MEFARRLSRLRKEKGWSQQQLAEATGTHPNIIGKYELGLSTPSVSMVRKLSEVLEVSIDYLLGQAEVNVDRPLMDKIKSLVTLPVEVRDAVLLSLDKIIGKATKQPAT